MIKKKDLISFKLITLLFCMPLVIFVAIENIASQWFVVDMSNIVLN